LIDDLPGISHQALRRAHVVAACKYAASNLCVRTSCDSCTGILTEQKVMKTFQNFVNLFTTFSNDDTQKSFQENHRVHAAQRSAGTGLHVCMHV
jgi:hypothetical protein